MGLDVWFKEDVARIMAAVAIARDGLTSDERTLLAAICAGFGMSLAEVLPPERRAVTATATTIAITMDALGVDACGVSTPGVGPVESAQPPFGVVMQLPALAEQPAAEEKGSARRFTHRP